MTEEDATVDASSGKVRIAEKVFDHGVDALAVAGITLSAYNGVADEVVVAGLVTIALGKRVTDYATNRKE